MAKKSGGAGGAGLAEIAGQLDVAQNEVLAAKEASLAAAKALAAAEAKYETVRNRLVDGMGLGKKAGGGRKKRPPRVEGGCSKIELALMILSAKPMGTAEMSRVGKKLGEMPSAQIVYGEGYKHLTESADGARRPSEAGAERLAAAMAKPGMAELMERVKEAVSQD